MESTRSNYHIKDYFSLGHTEREHILNYAAFLNSLKIIYCWHYERFPQVRLLKNIVNHAKMKIGMDTDKKLNKKNCFMTWVL